MLTALEPAAAENLAVADAFAIARAAVALCRQRAANGPVVILLEDAHRADTATLQVLRQVANWLRDQPVLMLITLRGSEAGPGLHASAAALAHHTADWLELTGLDLDATREAVRAAGLTEISGEALTALHRRTGGNPLFVRETAKLMAAQGGGDEVPDSIRELIATRLRRLSPEVTTVLGQLAIWGEGVDLRILGLATAIGEDRLIDLLAEAEVAALVRSDRTGRITFDHALIQESVYQSIPRLRRGRMHWAALELLLAHVAEFPGLARDPDMLAHHAILGARPETAGQAIDYVMTAARRSTDRGMAADTVGLWQAVLELHELAGHGEQHAARDDRIALLDAHCALVSAMAFQARWIEARAVRERAVGLAQQLGDPALLVRALTSWRAPILYPGIELPDPRRRLVHAVVDCLAEELPVADRVRLLAVASYETAMDYRDPGRSRRFAREALALARTDGDPELLCVALGANTIHRFCGIEDVSDARELLAIAEGAGLDQYRPQAHYALFRCALAVVELPEAYRQAELALATTTDAELPQLLLALSCFAATVAVLRDDFASAERLYAEADEQFSRLGFTEDGLIRALHVLSFAWVRGDLTPSVQRLRGLHAAAPYFAGPVLGLALLFTGDLEGARTLDAECSAQEPELFPSAEYACRAYLAIGLGRTDQLEPLYRRLLPYAGTIIGLESTGLVFEPMDLVLGRLSEALGESARAAVHFAASDALMVRIRAELSGLELPGLAPAGPRHRRTPVDAR